MTMHDGTRTWALNELIEAAHNELLRRGYSSSSRYSIRSHWRRFRNFCQEHAWQIFSQEVVAAYKQAISLPEEKLTPYQRDVRCALRMLTDMALHGSIQRRMRRTATDFVPPTYAALFDDFTTYCSQTLHLRRTTMRCLLGHFRAFLRFAHTQGHNGSSCLTHECFMSFLLTKTHCQPRTLACCAASLHSFCRYACLRGLVAASAMDAVPKIRVPQDATIPAIWKAGDIEKLLAAVDRASPMGKRDYAILLLAVRLGLRVGDIRGLMLDHLDWERGRIELKQAKTGQSLALPLGEECGQALIDWLRHRPPCQCRNVFVLLRAPFEPFGQDHNLYHVITVWRRRANIALPARSRCGLHSLRHTVASRMLEAGLPLETIAGTLGHRSPQTTRIYLKIDIEALRSAALDPREVSAHE
jgi:integrase